MALGSDLNSLAGEPGPRRALRAALPRARRVVCVSRALAAIARDLGVEEQRIDVVPNGVDTELFRPRDRAAARQRLGVPAHHRVVLFVGWLEESKGIFDLIEAYRRLPPSPTPTSLFLLGDGTARQRATELAAQLPGLRLLGARPPEEVSEWLAACDLLALPSWREGMPNALLEALACGRRVVASRVGGIPELIDSPVLGTLVEPRDPAALGQALASALATRYDPDQVVGQARLLSWQGSAALLRQALERARRSG
jgi:glycosyltransferase involved in cell wall biosynthesis